MKVCIYGAGVIGGVLASAIARGGGGHEVSVIARGAHLDAIRRNGLTVRTPQKSDTTHPQATEHPAELGPQDIVIVATKTPSLPDVARGIPPLIGRDTLVAFAVNGIYWFYGDGFSPGGLKLDTHRLDPDGALHAAVGAERALGFICYAGGEIKEPGIIEASRVEGRFTAGTALRETNERAAKVIRSLAPADISLEWSDNIRVDMWPKFFSVIGNFATASLTGGTVGQIQADPGTKAVYLGLTAEAYAVAKAHGFDFSLDTTRARMNPSTSNHKPSMLQDLERGRAMEIESTYGVLQDLARQANVPTPILDMVTPLLALRARTAGCPF